MQFPIPSALRCALATLTLAGGLGLAAPHSVAEPQRVLPPLAPVPTAASMGLEAQVERPLGGDFASRPIFAPGQRVVVAGVPRAPQPEQGDPEGTRRLVILGLGLGSTLLAGYCSLALRRRAEEGGGGEDRIENEKEHEHEHDPGAPAARSADCGAAAPGSSS